jgi:hypothetical protein
VGRNMWRQKRNRLVGPQQGLYQREDQVPGLGTLSWDKKEADFHWTDVLEPLNAMQQIAKAASNSQDFATIRIDTPAPVPVLFISDWHIGSWGISYDQVARMTLRIKELGLRIAILGDMVEMAIRLRSVLEVGGNLLSPRMQDMFLRSWLDDIAAWTLWATWDNHAVVRQEELSGVSQYAETFKERVVYHSGIGHVDLIVGSETYKIASSHKFAGNTKLNPTGGQERYMRFEGIDRELCVAGDSHRPSIKSYTDGPLERLAINCGTLHTDSGYAKRFFSLYTHDWMPVVVFHPSTHLMVSYPSLRHYEGALGLQSVKDDGIQVVEDQ